MLKLLLILTIFFLPFTTEETNKKDWLNEVNQLRARVHSKPLKYDPFLSFQATRYAKKMSRTKNFVHDPNLKTNLGENIAYSSDPVTDPIEVWKNSSPHYRNMIGRDFKKVGLGMASNGQEMYYVMRLK